MNLSIVDYVAVHNALRRSGTAAERGSDENRLGPRIAVEHEVLVTVMRTSGEAGSSFTAMARDLSMNGIGLLQHTPPPRRCSLIVHLPRVHRVPLRVLCDVAYVRELAEGVYAVGATFLRDAAPAVEQHDNAAEIARLRRAVID